MIGITMGMPMVLMVVVMMVTMAMVVVTTTPMIVGIHHHHGHDVQIMALDFNSAYPGKAPASISTLASPERQGAMVNAYSQMSVPLFP